MDRSKKTKNSTSGFGHLLGTGLLDHEEDSLLAARLARSDLDARRMAVNTWDRMGELSALIRLGDRISGAALGRFAPWGCHKEGGRLVLTVGSPRFGGIHEH